MYNKNMDAHFQPEDEPNWKLLIVCIAVFVIFMSFHKCSAQSFERLDAFSVEKVENQVAITSTCATPTGAMNETFIVPPNYPWLQTNGYCNPGAYGKNGTVCWTFITPGSDISVNSGYAVSGCASGGFGPFNLYTCAPACVLVGTGLSYSGLTSGACYTWCMGYSASGPPGCGYTDFCPYYQNNSPLPIELLYFKGYNQEINILEWKSVSNAENNYYTLELSFDTKKWVELARIEDNGIGVYQYKDYDFFNQINYYRLKQTDFNGSFKYHGIVVIDNTQLEVIIEVINLTGQLVWIGTEEGFKSSPIASGVYLIKSNNKMKKLIK